MDSSLVFLYTAVSLLLAVCGWLGIRLVQARARLEHRIQRDADEAASNPSEREERGVLLSELSHTRTQLESLRSQLELNQSQIAARDEELADTRTQAREAGRTKSLFVANMSHELRTPLNGILGLTRNLLDSDLSPQQRSEAELIRIAGEDLVRIVNDVLDLSKLEAGKLSLEHVPFDLFEMLESVFCLLYPQAERKQLTYFVTYSPLMPRTFVSDPFRIRQVVLNLLSNAIKFTASGTVSLHAEQAEHRKNILWVKFIVADTGIGIEREMQDAIFEEFQQADLSTTRKFGGTGLGLSLTKRIVDLLGGEVVVESQPQSGSRFTVSIPLALGLPSQSAGKREGNQEGNPYAGFRLLLQDRHTPKAQALHRVLEAIPGLEIARFQSASEAEQMLLRDSDARFDALVCADASTSFTVEQASNLLRRCGPGSPRLVVLNELPYNVPPISAADGSAIVLSSPILPSKVAAALRQLRSTPLEPLFAHAGVTAHDVYRDLSQPRETPIALLAHDNPIELRVLEGMLKKIGASYRSARDAKEIAAALQLHSFHALVAHTTLVNPSVLAGIHSSVDPDSPRTRLVLLGERNEPLLSTLEQNGTPHFHFTGTPRLAQLREILR